MFAYCHNNPVLFVDPTGHIIVLAPDATQEQIEEYEKAIAYLKTSKTGRMLLEYLEASAEVFVIVFVDDNRMGYCYNTNTISFDTNSGLIVGDGVSVQSAALGLAHEMGHAAQDLDGVFVASNWNETLVENANMSKYETPIAKELGEPTRRGYWDSWGFVDMQNSTHYRINKPHPWWHYVFFWKLFSPNTVDYNN